MSVPKDNGEWIKHLKEAMIQNAPATTAITGIIGSTISAVKAPQKLAVGVAITSLVTTGFVTFQHAYPLFAKERDKKKCNNFHEKLLTVRADTQMTKEMQEHTIHSLTERMKFCCKS